MTATSTLHIWDQATHGLLTHTLHRYHHGTIPHILDLKTAIASLGITVSERTVYRWLGATVPNTPCGYSFLKDEGREGCEGVVEYGACTECGRTPEANS